MKVATERVEQQPLQDEIVHICTVLCLWLLNAPFIPQHTYVLERKGNLDDEVRHHIENGFMALFGLFYSN